MTLPPIMDAAAWADLLQCSQKTVEERMRTGDLPGEKFGDPWICPTEAMLARLNEIAVERMLERRQKKDGSAGAPVVASMAAARGKRRSTLPASLMQSKQAVG